MTADKMHDGNTYKLFTLCQCGCEELTRNMFLPGHDMKLKGNLLRAAADGDAKAQAELTKRGWAK